MIRRLIFAALLPLLAVGGCAGSGTGETTATVPANDSQFVQTAGQDNLAEELAASYASTGAQSLAVKTFAFRMMADHANMAIGMRQVATAQGMTVPTSPSDTQIAEITAMSASHSGAFDKAYVAQEITRHKAMLQAYQGEAASGTNAAIKKYASDRLPVVQYNLTAAEALLSQG